MNKNLFSCKMANRIMKLQFVAGELGVAVAMPKTDSRNINNVANELSHIISEV